MSTGPQVFSRAALSALCVCAMLVTCAWGVRPADGGQDVQRKLGQVPLSFVGNAGQSDARVLFESRGVTGTVAFTSDAIYLTLPVDDDAVREGEGTVLAAVPGPQGVAQAPAPLYTLRMTFPGSSGHWNVQPGAPLPGRVNYFRGRDAEGWQRNLETFGEVVLTDVYDGIDVRYDGRVGRLKGTWLVDATIDPGVIAWRYQGADAIELDAAGNLVLRLPDHRVGDRGVLVEMAPVAWQEIDGVRVDVPVKFVVDGDVVSFDLGGYDATRPLVIDPTLIYGSFLGGNGTDHTIDIEVDALGHMYITGRTHSNPAILIGQGWPVTPGSFDPTYNGEVADAFVMKFMPDGSGLVYSGYLGGGNPVNFSVFGGADWGFSIRVNSLGQAVVGGFTESTNFPTTNDAVQPVKNGLGHEAFITIISADGSSIVYSTYLGGTGDDWCIAIDLDDNDAILATGCTTSIDFPVTPSAAQPFLGGADDAWFVKLVPATGIVYATYMGFNNVDQGIDVKAGPAGQAVIAGLTYSTLDVSTLPALSGINVLQPMPGGGGDGFVAVLDPNVSGPNGLLYFTYYGGNSLDSIFGLDVDDMGQIFITGITASPNFPVKFTQLPLFGGGDTFAASFFPIGVNPLTDRVFSVILGGTGFDEGFDIQCYQNLVFYVGLIQTPFGIDAFFIELSPFGQFVDARAYGSFFFDMALSVDVGPHGLALVGYTQCQNGEINNQNCPSTLPVLNAFQPVFGGGSGDGFVIRVDCTTP